MEIHHKKPRVKNPVLLKAKVVSQNDVKRIDVKTMYPELFKFHGKMIYESYDPQVIKSL